ncbi:MAG: S8 family serine peptidase, partial [Candidatus Eisenbacteria bacterium]|nr:S8 family serine peptidase [Candidatus Latescibacterota bacterium]MBD3301723.1 S8 family serine peptidase [Candidatus Eisenbacteria bacterium]
AAQLRAALADPSVTRVAPAVRCEPFLDLSGPETSLSDVHESHGAIPPDYVGLTGEGVLVGIVDSGIDLAHADFQELSGDTRLVAVWDQTVASSDPPVGFAYGKEWTAAQIDAGMATQVDTDGHGTHVAGIAAGNGAATGNGMPAYAYVGAAPNAMLVAVKTDYLTSSVADGVAYIFEKADSLGVPAVVNLSLGTHYGPHDGTGDFAQAIDLLVGPGRSVVAAAGNEAGDGIHAERTWAASGADTVSFTVPAYTPNPGIGNDEIDIDGWYTGGTNLSISVVTPSGTVVGPVAKGNASGASTADGRVEIDNATFPSGNGDHEVFLRIYDQTIGDPPAAGTWKIVADALSAPTEIDFWSFFATMGGVPFVLGLDETELVGSPATADSVLAVAAYVTKASWRAENGVDYGYSPAPVVGEIAPFSSVGPRRDGVMKPDLSAPGMAIGSARSADASFGFQWILQDGVHVISQGTSMAAPHVAGLAALIFEQLGPLANAALVDRLLSTCRKDGFTGGSANATWGEGKIDALAATGYVIPVLLSDASAVQEEDGIRVRFRLTRDAGTGPLPLLRQGPGDPEPIPIGWTDRGEERRFLDGPLEREGRYRYWVVFDDGVAAHRLGPATADFRLPRTLSLRLAPNPATGPVAITGRAPGRLVRIALFDPTGRRVRSIEAPVADGRFAASWDGRDSRGDRLAAGIYLIRVREGARSVEAKLVRLE